jgi:hypothetical protein
MIEKAVYQECPICGCLVSGSKDAMGWHMGSHMYTD